jgi:hypothetical protein
MRKHLQSTQNSKRNRTSQLKYLNPHLKNEDTTWTVSTEKQTAILWDKCKIKLRWDSSSVIL